MGRVLLMAVLAMLINVWVITKKAIECHILHLQITKEVGDKDGEGGANTNLGSDYCCLGDFKKAIEYHILHLKTVKEIGDKYGEGLGYCKLGNACCHLGDFKKPKSTTS